MNKAKKEKGDVSSFMHLWINTTSRMITVDIAKPDFSKAKGNLGGDQSQIR
jgi:hypothetical protein